MATTNTGGLPLPPVPYTKAFAQIVADAAAAIQAGSETPIDFTEGSVMLAMTEGFAGTSDWLQKLYLFSLIVQRLQTSQGLWVDTWTADFMPAVDGTNSPRLPATPATGAVTFSRNNPQSQAIVPVGALVSTFDGSQVYSVFADTTNAAYSATIIPGGGFIIPAGTASLNISVQALNPGTQGNVSANTITLIRSAVTGLDQVTNPSPLTTGIDQESDAALKARFKLYIASLSEATEGAIGYAIVSLQQGLTYTIHENIDPNGATDYGSVVVYINDGSGAPPASLVQKAATAVNNVRAAGTRPQVLACTALPVTISMTVSVASGFNSQTVIAAVANAVGAYVNTLGLEQPLYYTELAHVAYSASVGVTNVTSLLVNSATADITPAMGEVITVGTLTVN